MTRVSGMAAASLRADKRAERVRSIHRERAAHAMLRPDDRMIERDEEALMAAYAAGDKRAFDALFDLLAPRLLAFFRRSFVDGSAEDLLQITFVKLYAARASYRVGSPVRPWVFTIAARLRIDELRRRYRMPKSASDEELDQLEARSTPSAELSLEQDARDRTVRAAVAALPSSQRIVVELHRFESLTFAQIAAALGLEESTVRVRAFRAYGALRITLGALVAEEGKS